MLDLNNEAFNREEENNAVRLPSDLIQVLSYTIAEMESGKFCHLHWAVAMEKIEEHPAWYRDLPSAEDIFDIAEYVTTTYRSMERVTYCSECKFAYRNKNGERNPDDIICTYWCSDGLTQYDYCSKGEAGEYEWDEDCIEDANDWEDTRKGEDK